MVDFLESIRIDSLYGTTRLVLIGLLLALITTGIVVFSSWIAWLFKQSIGDASRAASEKLDAALSFLREAITDVVKRIRDRYAELPSQHETHVHWINEVTIRENDVDRSLRTLKSSLDRLATRTESTMESIDRGILHLARAGEPIELDLRQEAAVPSILQPWLFASFGGLLLISIMLVNSFFLTGFVQYLLAPPEDETGILQDVVAAVPQSL